MRKVSLLSIAKKCDIPYALKFPQSFTNRHKTNNFSPSSTSSFWKFLNKKEWYPRRSWDEGAKDFGKWIIWIGNFNGMIFEGWYEKF